MSGWYESRGPNRLDEPYVVLSGGPSRVDTGDPDPEFEPRPVGFVYTQPTVTEEDQARTDLFERMHDAEKLVLHPGGLIVAYERVCIADQDPDAWGDQA